MGLGIPPLNIKILLESNPLKYIILVLRLAVVCVVTTIMNSHCNSQRPVLMIVMITAGDYWRCYTYCEVCCYLFRASERACLVTHEQDPTEENQVGKRLASGVLSGVCYTHCEVSCVTR